MALDAEKLVSMARQDPNLVYGEALRNVAATHDKVVALTADTGHYVGAEAFAAQFPERFFDVGISEQNLIGMAAGLAASGYNAFASTFAVFITERVFELLKLDVSYCHLNVKLIGLSSGLSATTMGNSHYCCDDIALTTLLPGFTVLAPGDKAELYEMVTQLSDLDGPVYVRINVNQMLHTSPFTLTLGKAMCMTPETELGVQTDAVDVCLVSYGSMVSEALRAAKAITRKGYKAAVYNFHTLKPLDEEALRRILTSSKLVVTLEEHYVQGGLGSMVAQFKGLHDLPAKLLTYGIAQGFFPAGSYLYLLKENRLGASFMVPEVLQVLAAL